MSLTHLAMLSMLPLGEVSDLKLYNPSLAIAECGSFQRFKTVSLEISLSQSTADPDTDALGAKSMVLSLEGIDYPY